MWARRETYGVFFLSAAFMPMRVSTLRAQRAGEWRPEFKDKSDEDKVTGFSPCGIVLWSLVWLRYWCHFQHYAGAQDAFWAFGDRAGSGYINRSIRDDHRVVVRRNHCRRA
jgi:hypothetical protein